MDGAAVMCEPEDKTVVTETNLPDTSINSPDTSVDLSYTSKNSSDTSIDSSDTSRNPPDTSINPPNTSTTPPDSLINSPDTAIIPHNVATNPPNIATSPCEPTEQIASPKRVSYGSRKLTQEEKNIRLNERRRKKAEIEREQAEERKESALNQMRYLLTVCEEYSEVYRKTIMDQKTQPKVIMEKNKNYVTTTLSEVEEIRKEIKLKRREIKDCDVSKHLKYFEGGKLHPYQVEGVTWLYMLYANGSNGILADEMGLGKTIQIIALICVLLEQEITGPFLIVAPLSTIPNWQSEFQKFAPKIPVVTVCGSAENRRINLQRMRKQFKIGQTETYPVVLATYQTPLIEFYELNRHAWRYIIVDEGHRIKNHQSQLAKKLRELQSKNRLLLTGTPLQNNMIELWSLLNFLLPTFFSNMSIFTELFLLDDMKDGNRIIEQEECNNLVSKIHNVLGPFMLRRLKKDVLSDMVPKKEVTVYCPLSPLQMKLYDFVIEKNIAGLRRLPSDDVIDLDQPRPKRKCTMNRNYTIPDEDDLDFDDELQLDEDDIKTSKAELKKFAVTLTRITMQNTLVMFRKIVNHPYLVHFPLDPDSEVKTLLINEDLVTSSGKLMVLDTLLPKLKKLGHKILLFSQLVMGLDMLEEYMLMRGFNYRRLDGSHSLEDRAANIDDFNKDPNVLIFLLSTRAGGLGLNLSSADTVIFFDRDWNPQMDIQAQDRCHRLGQTKPVIIYTLVAKNTIDDAIINAGKLKRVLEKVVISDGKFKTITQDDKARTEDVLKELRNALKQSADDDSYIFSNQLELEKLLDRSDLYEQMRNKASQIKSNKIGNSSKGGASHVESLNLSEDTTVKKENETSSDPEKSKTKSLGGTKKESRSVKPKKEIIEEE